MHSKFAAMIRQNADQPNFSVGTRSPRHIVLCGGLASSLVNFRGALVRTLLAKGHRVTALAGNNDPAVAAQIKQWGGTFEWVSFARAGMNPVADAMTIIRLSSLLRDLRPDVFVGYTIKPVMYGLVAARMAGIPNRSAMITGLGYAFTEGPEFKRRIAKSIAQIGYRLALSFADNVIFQNPDDEGYFSDNRLLGSNSRPIRVNGSGVDLNHFAPVALPGAPFTFLMIARLLKDKGVYEYVESARRLKARNPAVRFLLVGAIDPNPASITCDEVKSWQRDGVIEYLGELKDVRQAIASCHVYVLPSYREGTPRTVLEAMAMSRAVITTDAPGCRQTIQPGSSGWLVKPRSTDALQAAMLESLHSLNEIEQMGRRARNRAELLFSDVAIADQIVDALACS
ncbi:MAG: glycosyltransferase family 4 protein [Micropepsaceae bacterium]